MENGLHNGARTNHDRDTWTNGINGGPVKREISPDKGKSLVAEMVNGGDGTMMDVDSEPLGANTLAVAHPNELSDEIQHITADILPLNLILARLAQYTHSQLLDQLAKLASKPLPQAAVNGNASYQFTGAEDTSPESLDKKVMLLKTIQDFHTKWVKALVITEWSKKADKVSRLIDIRAHLAGKLDEFSFAFGHLIKNKQELHWAKKPSPDLKTALEILSSGEVSWLPDFGYLEPPPLSSEERLAWIENINTLLSVRLSFDEYDKIPPAFKEYRIEDGRAIFTVPGEFEVDLTIGDEDPDQQFWFIDFRFLFTPAPAEMTEPVRAVLEAKVNQILGTEGLVGCYKYLHEYVLTQKITELWRQAAELSRARWVDSLKVERLNRAMSIQYWTNRPHSQGTKSWIILGVNSNNGPDGLPNPKKPSCLFLRWFRDGKEVKDFDMSFDFDSISAENLITTVIGSHIDHLLGAIYNKLSAKTRFAERHARLALDVSRNDPSGSSLTLQLFDQETATVRIEAMTGAFFMLPPVPHILDGQRWLNGSPNPAEDASGLLESIRWYYTAKDLSSRSDRIGWSTYRNLIPGEELKTVVQSATRSKESFHTVWLKKLGWAPPWFLIMTMSLGGDQWWLVELTTQGVPSPRIRLFTKIPMTSGQVSLSDRFFEHLTIYVSGMISQITDSRELHSKRLNYVSRRSDNYGLPPEISLPTIFIRLSEMVRPRDPSNERPSTPWAVEYVPIVFKGVQGASEDLDADIPLAQPKRDSRFKVVAEAKITVLNKSRFQLLKARIDHDVAYDSRLGQFTLQLRAEMGQPVVALLAARVRSLERLVDFVGALHRAGKNVVAESLTLREIVFTYRNGSNDDSVAILPDLPQEETRAWRVQLSLNQDKDKRVRVSLEPGNPHLSVLDYLTQTANSPALESIPSWLLITLPLFRALSRMEKTWAPMLANNEAYFCPLYRGFEAINLRFTIGLRRTAHVEIRPRFRKGQIIWHIRRRELDNKMRNDEFDRILHQKVWTAQDDGIKGLGTSAAADVDKGIEKVLGLISNAMRSLVGTPAPGPVPSGAAQEAGSGPANGMPQQQHQSMQQQSLQQQSMQHQSMQQQSMQQQSMQQQSMQEHSMQHAQAQAQARLAHQQAIAQRQQQVNQRGGGGAGMGIGSSNAPVVVLD